MKSAAKRVGNKARNASHPANRFPEVRDSISEAGKFRCQWCGEGFYVEVLTMDGFCSARCEEAAERAREKTR